MDRPSSSSSSSWGTFSSGLVRAARRAMEAGQTNGPGLFHAHEVSATTTIRSGWRIFRLHRCISSWRPGGLYLSFYLTTRSRCIPRPSSAASSYRTIDWNVGDTENIFIGDSIIPFFLRNHRYRTSDCNVISGVSFRKQANRQARDQKKDGSSSSIPDACRRPTF